jgi:hypothetical protein
VNHPSAHVVQPANKEIALLVIYTTVLSSQFTVAFIFMPGWQNKKFLIAI